MTCDDARLLVHAYLDDELDALGTLLVAEETLEHTFAGPAAVAVHNDSDMLRHAVRIELPIDGLLIGREFLNPAWDAAWDATGGIFAQNDLES